MESKTVKKFQSRKRIQSADSQQLGDNEKYLVDKLVKLEETRMEQQLKIERERMENEQAQHQATLQFQREMVQMMMQMQHTHQTAQPSLHFFTPAYRWKWPFIYRPPFCLSQNRFTYR